MTTPLYTDSYLPSEESQIKLYKDVIRDYFHHPVLIKPHPRDTVDYKKIFPECAVIHEGISAEVLNFCQNLRLGTVLTVNSSSGQSFKKKAGKLINLSESINMTECLKAYQ